MPIMSPEGRELFEITRADSSPEKAQEARERRAKFEQKFNKLLDLERDEGRSGKKSGIAEAGAAAGRAFIKYIASREDNVKDAIQKSTQEIRGLFTDASIATRDGIKKAEKFNSGFVCEYAIARGLSEYLGREVYYPANDEDEVKKIDWIIEDENEKGEPVNIYLQVKSIWYDLDQAKKPKFLFNINSPEEIELAMNELYSSQIFNEETDTGYYRKAAEEMLQKNQGDNAKLALLLLPASRLNYNHGEFDEEVLSQIDEEIAELVQNS